MSGLRTVSLLLALALHAYVLWGWKREPPGVALAAGEPDAVQVELFAETPAAAEAEPEPQTQPPPPEPPPVPPEPMPPPPDPIPAPAEIPMPAPEREPEPQPVATPAPRPKPAPRPPTTKSTRTTAKPGVSAPGGALGGSGDAEARARWKRRVVPDYPSAAKRAGQRGSVQVLVSVNALGQPVGARIIKSSGYPMLDDAALRAARSSQFFPKKIFGLPAPDSVIAPYTFRIE